MLDFVKIKEIEGKKSTVITPEFIVGPSKDLMIRGRSFYAIWDEEAGFWSKKEQDVQRLIDQMIFEHAKNVEGKVKLKLLRDFSSTKWSEWQKYCKSLPDNYHELDEQVLFKNSEVSKEDFATRTLSYELVDSDTPAYNEFMSVVYDEKEREKLEWGIGSIISGDSKWLQKFFVLYGGPGTGKSTMLNLISELLKGYTSIFDAKALSSGNNAFALEAFRTNPLVAIQHDGDLSRIEDNTKINSIVSHEEMTVNEKFKSSYTSRFKSMLFMATNKPVKITDAKSGILRRLIDVQPTGNTMPYRKYMKLSKQIPYELGGIAYKCLGVYERCGPDYYNDYVPNLMLGVTNEFYIFLEDNYDMFAYAKDDTVTLSSVWTRYKEYCQQANVKFPMSMRAFKEELISYYKEYYPRLKGLYSVYIGFRKDKFGVGLEEEDQNKQTTDEIESWLKLKEGESEFELRYKDCLAQYANEKETPIKKWEQVTSTLEDLDTSKIHYVKVPSSLIVIDFDLKDEDGNKNYERNIKAASEWPQTYAEVSKGGAGLHLHYIYDGDISELSHNYKEGIEIKTFCGKSSLRRRLSKCNNFPIAHISSGLPLRERRKMVPQEVIKSEKSLRDLIRRNLKKEIHPGTKPSMDFIYKILEDAYNSDLAYDVTDLRPAIQIFAMNSTHQADYCLRLVSKMPFMSKDVAQSHVQNVDDGAIIFFDVEVFPNLFLVCYKKQGKENPIVCLINPLPQDIEELCKFRLVGFYNRKYDNHILYAKMMGYTEEELFRLSQRIVADQKGSLFLNAYNLSYTDIYDFLSAQNKMSLKKWEIKLGIHHQELGLPWDQPVPKEKWELVKEYCGYDVLATEATWDANQADWTAREILADIAEMSVNDTTNSLTTKIIVGNDKNPQDKYIYTNLAETFPGYEFDQFGIDKSRYKEGIKIVNGKSIYMGEDPGEGGYVYAEPGIYTDVAVLDIASMHPHSAIALNIFGSYTERFKELVQIRLLIKHKEFEKAKNLLDGRLSKYLDDESKAKALANALKTAINSVYGLTSAKFPNLLKDPRNVDNIVAKRGGLFMITLKHEVQKRGFTVAHIKTDSIKIPNATPEIIQFVMEFGKKYGYTFEYEATYERMCLVNDAVYIAKVGEEDGKKLENPYWTATGAQFQVPYVFKTLFSKEPIEFEDLCETKSVSTALYLDMNEKKDPEGFGFVGEEFHDYRFVGKVGLFCPMKDGAGGGLLLREIAEERRTNGKRFSSANGAKNGGKLYRWMESEVVKENGLIDSIDRSYYDCYVDEAIDTISEYGDFERFVSDDPYLSSDRESWLYVDNEIEGDELPFPMNPPESIEK